MGPENASGVASLQLKVDIMMTSENIVRIATSRTDKICFMRPDLLRATTFVQVIDGANERKRILTQILH